MVTLETLRIELYVDSAALEDFRRFAPLPYIGGFTTNPSLMRKAGVTDYLAYVKEALALAQGKPVSFEVIADDFHEMRRQALLLASKGDNVFVKIPIMNTRREETCGLIRELCAEGVKVNVTALFLPDQVSRVAEVLRPGLPSLVSVFAGRIADTGVDPVPLMKECRRILKVPGSKLLWASQREILNIIQAQEVGCEVITVQPSTLDKLKGLGTDLLEASHQTVVIFARDAAASGFNI